MGRFNKLVSRITAMKRLILTTVTMTAPQQENLLSGLKSSILLSYPFDNTIMF